MLLPRPPRAGPARGRSRSATLGPGRCGRMGRGRDGRTSRGGRRMTTVIVIGGGVAGMSAAHELIERGYTVRVFERQALPGGKARSVTVDGTGKNGRKDLPGEHGFRFFPRFYR